MSLESIFSNIVTQKVANTMGNQEQDIHALFFALKELNTNIKILAQLTPRPIVFLKGNTTLLNSGAADALILSGPQTQQGYIGTITDFNINFTSAGGSIKLVLLDANNTVIQTLSTISADANGWGGTVIDENQRLGLIVGSSGAANFTVYCTGEIQRKMPLDVG